MQLEMRDKSDTGPSLRGETQVPAVQPAQWTLPTKIAFRFGFVYFALFNLELFLHLLPFPPFTQFSWLWDFTRGKTVVWVSKHVLHLKHDFATDYLNSVVGSKDTTYYYMQALCYLVIAAVATLIWSLWDRKRQEYVWLHRWFLLGLRVTLAAALIPYGTVKLFPTQFPPPTLSQLLDTYGNSTPRQLLWISMGVSPIYSFFGGLMEVVPGLLLMTPPLVTLGALLSTAAMGNVLMLNFGYDVEAKLFVINLFLMGMVILLPDLSRLADFFVLNRRIPAVAEKALFRRKSLNRAALVLQIAFGVVLLSYNVYRSHQLATQFAAARKTPLSGIWFVDEFQVNGEPKPPLSTNAHRWQRMIVNYNDQVVVQVMTGVTNSLFLRADPRMKSLVLTQPGNPDWIAELTYDDSRPGSLVLSGKMGGLPALIRLHREDESRFPLNDHSIHWISDAVK